MATYLTKTLPLSYLRSIRSLLVDDCVEVSDLMRDYLNYVLFLSFVQGLLSNRIFLTVSGIWMDGGALMPLTDIEHSIMVLDLRVTRDG